MTVGVLEGEMEGSVVDGVDEGRRLGRSDGPGDCEGLEDRMSEGFIDGIFDRTMDGIIDGIVDCTMEGVIDGIVERTMEGRFVGTVDIGVGIELRLVGEGCTKIVVLSKKAAVSFLSIALGVVICLTFDVDDPPIVPVTTRVTPTAAATTKRPSKAADRAITLLYPTLSVTLSSASRVAMVQFRSTIPTVGVGFGVVPWSVSRWSRFK